MIAGIRPAAAPIAASALVACLFGVACGASEDPGVCTGDTRTTTRIFNGTPQPSQVILSPGQILAIGGFDGCSGVAIAPTWILTARHCELTASAQFCTGEAGMDAAVCVAARTIVDHPLADLTLVELTEDLTVRLPGLLPISVLTQSLDTSVIGQSAEAAGYGVTESNTDGMRRFVAAPIVGLPEDLIVIDGQGKRGTCFGDSGGPLLVAGKDGAVAVAGVLGYGHSSCVGRAFFARADLELDWISRQTGNDEITPACGNLDAAGRCATGATQVLRCQDGAPFREACSAGTTCGWDEAAAGFRCIAGQDPCAGHDGLGGCDGDVAAWCENGVLLERDCGACGEICSPLAIPAGAYCIADPCMGLDFRGRCNGDVVEWCDDGQFLTRDCTATGKTCGLIDADNGYFCH